MKCNLAYMHQVLLSMHLTSCLGEAFMFVKVILYSYLILKKMNERTTDS